LYCDVACPGDFSQDEAETRAKSEVFTRRGTGRRLLVPPGGGVHSDSTLAGALQTVAAAVEYFWTATQQEMPR
jgi:hypothetical protein